MLLILRAILEGDALMLTNFSWGSPLETFATGVALVLLAMLSYWLSGKLVKRKSKIDGARVRGQ